MGKFGGFSKFLMQVGNQKQYDFNTEVIQVYDELAEALDKKFKDFDLACPPPIKSLLEKGIEKLKSRNKDLLRADDAGWSAVEHFHRDPLCADETEEKRWKRAKAEAKEKSKEKRSTPRGGGGGGGFGALRGRGRGSLRGYGVLSPAQLSSALGGAAAFMPRERGGWGESWRRYKTEGLLSNANSFVDAGQTFTSASRSESSPGTAEGAASTATRRRAATSPPPLPKTSQIPSSLDIQCGDFKLDMPVKNVAKEAIKNTLLLEFDSEESKLDRLEKVTVTCDEGNEVLIYEEEQGVELLVYGTLKRHLGFWEESGASTFAKSVIRDGFKLNLLQVPGKYEEPNNASYRVHKNWANQAVGKLKQASLVKKVSKEELECCNPLTVASNAAGKLRLCIDLSRRLNEVVKAPKFRIESTREALQVVKPNDWAFVFDLKSAYHQVQLHKDDHKYFGFKIELEDGKVEYYCYVVMPFGLNDASRVLTKVLKSPLERWRSMGIRVFIHIDDGLGFCSSKEECLKASEQVRGDLIKYGLLISENKCSWGASQLVQWTGLVWDFKNFKLWVPEEKLQRAETEVKSLLECSDKEVPVKQVAKVAGLLGSFSLAMGSMVRFRTRALLINIARVTENRGWGVKTLLGTREVDELLFWEQRLRDLNGYVMRKRDRVEQVSTRHMFSDASEFLLAGAEFVGETRKKDSEYQACLIGDELGTSSTYRELRAIEEGLKVHGKELQGAVVRWGCDNWAAGVIVKVGSMKPACHEVALRIAELVKLWEIELEAFWLSRDEPQIQEVDSLSKEFDTGDYKLSRADFEILEQDFGPFEVDMFASSFSFQFHPFVARVACSQAAAVDAFTIDWGRAGFMFLHPPVGLIVRVLRYAEACKATGLLVVPFWPGAIFMTELRALEATQKVQLVRRFRPELVSPEWIKSKTFHGPARFDFLVYLVKLND